MSEDAVTSCPLHSVQFLFHLEDNHGPDGDVRSFPLNGGPPRPAGPPESRWTCWLSEQMASWVDLLRVPLVTHQEVSPCTVRLWRAA